MDTIEQATGILRTAEQGLRELIVAAAGRGEYDHLPRLADWAKQLNVVLAGPVAPGPPTGTAPFPVSDSDGANGRSTTSGLGQVPRAARSSGTGPGRTPPGSGNKKKQYPRFLREGDTLVKIGWSKHDRKTYEHRAPRRVLDAFVQAVVRAGAGGERFAMGGILPLKDTVNSSDIPDYQAYLTLAWLRDSGLLAQHGRQGYSLLPDTELPREAARLWAALTAR